MPQSPLIVTRTRDLLGYAGSPPDPRWPGGARVAVSIVVNFEEGAEFSINDGDPENEAVYEIEQRLAGRPDPAIDSHFEYGSRAGWWRIMEVLGQHGAPATVSSSGRAVERLPLLIDAMEGRRQMADLEESLSAIANRIQVMGGVTIDYDVVARMRADLNRVVAKVRDALDQIQATGCIVKDLDSGLVDFPSVIRDEEVYLCWRLGEDRIRFYHRQDEGFSGRKPIDPEDTGPQHPIQ